MSFPRAVTAVLALSIASAGTARADRAATRTATSTADTSTSTGPGASAASDPGAGSRALRSTLTLAAGEARWELRATLGTSDYDAVRRAAGVALALASGSPADALSAAFSPTRPILTVRPVDGELSSGYGVRRDPFHHRRRERHKGVDLVADRGTPVHAAGPGVVVIAGRKHGYGRVIYIDHGGGLQTRYAHLNRILVHAGEFVPAAALIGQVGSSGHATGPHLHFEVREHGVAVPPRRILDWLVPAPAVHDGESDSSVRAAETDKPAKRHHSRRHHHHHPPHELLSARPQS